MPKLLNQRQAARHINKSVKWFREVCKQGEGPRVFDPLDGRKMYVDEVLDEWIKSRDDRPQRRAS